MQQENYFLSVICIAISTSISGCKLNFNAPVHDKIPLCKEAIATYEKNNQQDLSKRLKQSEQLWSAFVNRYEHLKKERKLYLTTEGINNVTDILEEYISANESMEFAENLLTCTGFYKISDWIVIDKAGEAIHKQSWNKDIPSFIEKTYVKIELSWKNEKSKSIQQRTARIVLTLK